MKRVVKAGIVQAAPVPLAMQQAVDHAVALARQAIEAGVDIVALGESFLGGYPLWLDEAPGAALWDHPGTRELHALLLTQALRDNDPRLRPLQKLADKSGTLISLGGHERVRSSLYNTQYLFRPKAPVLLHRKLVPTHAERMIWGRGDGSTLAVHQAEWGKVGQLICWEHWMPLARAAMHHEGEAIHVAAWPTVRDLYLLASCHYAFEGRCFVLAAGTVQDKQDLLEGLEMAGGNGSARKLLQSLPEGQLQFGNSAIIAPDGVVVAQAGSEPMFLTAELNLEEINRGLTSLDVDGHFSRPDVFELHIDRRPRPGLVETELDRDVA